MGLLMNKEVLEQIFESLLDENPALSEESASQIAKEIFFEKSI